MMKVTPQVKNYVDQLKGQHAAAIDQRDAEIRDLSERLEADRTQARNTIAKLNAQVARSKGTVNARLVDPLGTGVFFGIGMILAPVVLGCIVTAALLILGVIGLGGLL